MKFVLAHAFKAPDARLIAAAPALLEALEGADRLLSTLGIVYRGSFNEKQIKSAIALAKGEPITP